jgi:FtsP/CotA-like multicopper oxidase with cupredoxin domain
LNPTARLNNTEQGQYVDGLRSPLVIHPSTEVHSYDAEYTIILGDWYHNEHSTLLQRFISISNPSGGEPVPGELDKLLISSDSKAQSSLRIGRLSIDLLCPE